MKNRYGICVLVILFCICAAIFVFSALGESKQEKEQTLPITVEEETTETKEVSEIETISDGVTEQAKEARYVILEEDGHLIVYYVNDNTVFFDSGILTDHLPVELRGELSDGIFFSDEEELYEFLENYAS